MPNYYDVLDIVKALEEKMILAEIVAPTILQAIAIVFDREAFTFFDTCTDYLKTQRGSNAEHGKTALNSFSSYCEGLTPNEITPRLVSRYMNDRIKKGFSPNGVHSYLRHLTTMFYSVSDNKNPFTGVRPKKQPTMDKIFSDIEISKIINTRSLKTKWHKRYTVDQMNYYRYYWMLMFYFGGIDLYDLAHLKYENIKGGRVLFRRGKGGSDEIVSNKLFEPAKELLSRFDCKPYLVPILRDHSQYKHFTSSYSRIFGRSIIDLELPMQPYSKSARYSFINRGKQLLIDERIVKQIVGHAENSTHSIYSGKFPNSVTDAAHLSIITLINN